MNTDPRWIAWFQALDLGDVPRVGGKNASLGELYQALRPLGVRVPNGFAITAEAYRAFLRHNRLETVIADLLGGLDPTDIPALQHTGHALRHHILAGQLPPALAEQITTAYEALSGDGPPMDVAVRSSATAEDLPEASFAGQQETYLNVVGAPALLNTTLRCFASLFTDRAISYRAHHGFDHMAVALSVGVQQMVRSDKASAGVLFSIDTESGFEDVVFITAAWGLGENVVQGTVNPDEFYVFKPTLKEGYRPIIKKSLGTKALEMVYDQGGGRMTRNRPVSAQRRARFCLDDDEILTLARWACEIEAHYSKHHGRHVPMDMEWAKDGRTGELFIVQARPETVHASRKRATLDSWRLKEKGPLIATGHSVGEAIGVGPARVIATAEDLVQLKDGEVLVTDRTDPDWEPAMKRAAAIVTDRGGRTCHAAIVSRELGIPAVVGTVDGSQRIKTGEVVTVSCAEGDEGHVYKGALAVEHERRDLDDVPTTRTQIMMNIANPGEALRLAQLPSAGVGLARMEFIISNHIGIHPLALTRFDQLKDAEAAAEIARRTHGYANKAHYFVDRLAEGIGTIAAAFYPRDVIVRLSDFKTNEYAGLLGGAAFEPAEENPMLGFRGASRYYHPDFSDAFDLECRALWKVRENFGLRNIKIMVPFCRTPAEGKKVIDILADNGLIQGSLGLDIYVMCEIPSNVILADDFARIFDGFSIGSNDLTQLVLGVDRDSEIIADLFDERSPAVTQMVSQVIAAAKRARVKIGICGQAPSDYPEFARFLVREGIDSISLNPDVVIKTTLAVHQMERELHGGG